MVVVAWVQFVGKNRLNFAPSACPIAQNWVCVASVAKNRHGDKVFVVSLLYAHSSSFPLVHNDVGKGGRVLDCPLLVRTP